MSSSQMAIVPGSLGAISQANHRSLAESFLNADAIVLVDVSGSMFTADAPGGRRRYDFACSELARVQHDLPGRVAVVAFSSDAEFIPGGVPPFDGGSTNLTAALRFVRPADGTVKFIVISDGFPDNPDSALNVASMFTSQIDTVYCGPESDRRGRDFLAQLARQAKGHYVESLATADLGKNVTKLLQAG